MTESQKLQWSLQRRRVFSFDFKRLSLHLCGEKIVFATPSIIVRPHHQMLTSFSLDQDLIGKQAARLADQVLKGARPAALPVEMTEFYLAINLKAAKIIGLTIPDEILCQADVIIR